MSDVRSPVSVKVWDGAVRITHWAVAALVVFDFLDDSGGPVHRNVGYVAAGLVLFRLMWSAFGGRHARFDIWWPTRSRIAAYLRAWRRGKPPRHLSHNPLGGLMAITIWTLVLALAVTGWMSRLDAFWGEDWVQDLHAVIAYVLLGCAVVHVAAVIVMSRLHRENLLAAMITGRKKID